MPRRPSAALSPVGIGSVPFRAFVFVSVLCAVCRTAGRPLSYARQPTALFSPLGLVLSPSGVCVCLCSLCGLPFSGLFPFRCPAANGSVFPVGIGSVLLRLLCLSLSSVRSAVQRVGSVFSDTRRQTALFSPLGSVLSPSGFALVSALCAVCRLAGRLCLFRRPAARRGFTWCSHGGSPGATRPCYNRAIPEQRKGSPPAGTPAGNPESAAALPQGGGFLCERSPLPCCPVRPPVPDTPKAVTKPVPPGNCTVRSVPEKHAAGPIWSITAAGVPTLNGAAGGWIPTGHSGNSLPVTHLPGGVPAAAGFCRSEGFLSWIIFLCLPHRACRCAAFSVFWCWAPVICSCVG